MEALFFVSVAIVVLGTVGIMRVPEPLQGVATVILMAAIFFVIGFLLWSSLIEPMGPVSKTIAIAVAAYSIWRLVNFIIERRRN